MESKLLESKYEIHFKGNCILPVFVTVLLRGGAYIDLTEILNNFVKTLHN